MPVRPVQQQHDFTGSAGPPHREPVPAEEEAHRERIHCAGGLTSVDVETEHQRLARRAFTDAGFASNRFRLISGKAAGVLPRLTDGGYDLVFCDADKQEYPAYLAAALRLLRPGGVVVFDNALWDGRVADPGQTDPETSAIREVTGLVRQDEHLVPLLLPVGDGLLAAVKRG